MKRDCVDERSEEFSGVERRVLKRGDISFDEERNQMSIQVLCRRGGTEKILGAECQEDYLSGAPPSVGAERTKNCGFYKPPRWPETALLDGSKLNLYWIDKEYVSIHFEILPAVPISWSTWQMLGEGAKHTFSPLTFLLRG